MRALRVLVGCETSRAVASAFERLGHYALSCDLLPADAPGTHYQGDIFDVIGDGWDLAIFHPPCTYLCSSGLHWNGRREGRAEKTEEALAFVLGLMQCNIPRWAIENPKGCIGTRIRPANQTLQPFQYGDDASKSTCLWLHNLPPLRPTGFAAGRNVGATDLIGGSNVMRWANQTDSGQNRLTPSPDRWKERSKTYSGIADAMASQWSRFVLSLDKSHAYPSASPQAAQG